MAAGIIYLDVDDEITSAAARIRAVAGRRVALVLPYGSRVATSRINFRLLARDALTHEKQLPSWPATPRRGPWRRRPACRSSARSGSTRRRAEPTAIRALPRRSPRAPGWRPRPRRLALRRRPRRHGRRPRPPRRHSPARPATDPGRPDGRRDRAGAAGPADARRHGSGRAGRCRRSDPGGTRRVAWTLDAGFGTVDPRGAGRDLDPRRDRPAHVPRDSSPGRPGPGRHARRQRRAGMPRTPLLVGLAAIALAVLVGGVGAYLLLPVGDDRGHAQGGAGRPGRDDDPRRSDGDGPGRGGGRGAGRVRDPRSRRHEHVPGHRQAGRDDKATGTVRFENRDPTSSNTIPSGASCATESGVRFRTSSNVTVPKAELRRAQDLPALCQRQGDRGRQGPRRERRAEHDQRGPDAARTRIS